MDLRYSRQLALPGFGPDEQARLAASRVLVIGAGGLGSSVIPSLAAAGVGTIGIVDDDTVELSNLHRQLMHGMSDVGHRKVASAVATVGALNPSTTVIAVPERLTAATALDLFSAFDLVLDGSDNFATRYLASDAATLTGIPLVWGSVSQYGGQASVALPGGPGYRDLFPAPPPPGSVLSCEVGGVMPTVVALIGSIMSTEAIKLITGIGTPLTGRVTIVDALTGSFRELSFAKDPTAAPITGLIDYEAFCEASTADGISPAELAGRTDDFTLLDVREPWEAVLVALPGSTLIPLGSLAQRLSEIDRSKPVVAYCHHGVRSAGARDILAAAGLDATHLTGGIDAWAVDLDSEMARY
ncbi:adenylyltransferase/sulfurtransferase [Salinibacterium sp. CAN_S4]|uniref:ThiF family adenylyltransferase n=1 Tax=Salinibacterium sp. CAN_S4 TaxID=2787727 RepID=UPI0018F058FE